MTLRGRLVSVLLFLGLFMVVPLGFSIADLWDLEAAVERLGSPGSGLGAGAEAGSGQRGAGELLAERVLQLLTEVVARGKRYGSKRSSDEKAKILKAHGRFEVLWKVFFIEDPRSFASVPGVGRLLGLTETSGREEWKKAYDEVRSHGAASWGEKHEDLKKALDGVLAARGDKKFQAAFKALKGAAIPFRNRLLEVGRRSGGQGGNQTSNVLLAAQVRGAGKVVLEELVDTKRREITRIVFLVAVGGILALLFARILWRDLLGPLERLRKSINNMSMSGNPTPVETHGPREVRELLQAYNRLIDMIAAEGQRSDVKPCPKCSVQVELSDSYCRACGFPL